jgi:hypothetical protein
MRTNRLLILGGLGAILLAVAWVYFRPALTPEASVRASLLAETPLGTSMDAVRTSAERHGWVQPGAQLTGYMTFATSTGTVGTGTVVNAFSGRLRHDPFPYRTSLSATWEFDLSNRLVNISVVRHE